MSETYKCDICDRKQVEYIGIMCGKYKVCMICIKELVKKEVKKNELDRILQNE